ERRQDHDLRPGPRHHPARRLDPVHPRHPHVHEDDVRADPPEQFQRLHAVAGLTDDLYVGLRVQHHPDPRPHQLLIVDQRPPDGRRRVLNLRHAHTPVGRTRRPRPRSAPSRSVLRGDASSPGRTGHDAPTSSRTGIRATTSNPPPARGAAWTEPPYTATRSRIPAMPWPRPSSGAAAPRPSSSTRTSRASPA